MCRVVISLAVCLVLLSASQSLAQTRGMKAPSSESISSQPTTPQMWFYTQAVQRYDDPQLSVRRKAEARAVQRRNRLAAQRWFGYSNRRPLANPPPLCGSYAPGWTGNTFDPLLWSGIGAPAIIVGRTYVPITPVVR